MRRRAEVTPHRKDPPDEAEQSVDWHRGGSRWQFEPPRYLTEGPTLRYDAPLEEEKLDPRECIQCTPFGLPFGPKHFNVTASLLIQSRVSGGKRPFAEVHPADEQVHGEAVTFLGRRQHTLISQVPDQLSGGAPGGGCSRVMRAVFAHHRLGKERRLDWPRSVRIHTTYGIHSLAPTRLPCGRLDASGMLTTFVSSALRC